jgi:Skp family chaperone for outer membrane proteins
MKSGHRVPVAALVRVWAILPIACMFLLAPSFARADASAPQKVAIANTARIFNDMQETKDLKDKLEARRQEVSNEENDRRTKIKAMQDNLHELKPDNPQYEKAQQDLDQAMADFDSWGKVVRLQAERDQKQTMVMLFNKIQAAVTQIAKEDQIDIVIADQGPDIGDTEDLTFDQLRALINQKDVLYTSKRADISDEVLTLLDAQYAKDKAAEGTGK